MTWYKIQAELVVTADDGRSVKIPGGLWRVEVTPRIIFIGMSNRQTRIAPDQWESILSDRLALPIPDWDKS